MKDYIEINDDRLEEEHDVYVEHMNLISELEALEEDYKEDVRLATSREAKEKLTKEYIIDKECIEQRIDTLLQGYYR